VLDGVAGLIHGSTAAPAVAEITLRVTDALGSTAQSTAEVRVVERPSPLVIDDLDGGTNSSGTWTRLTSALPSVYGGTYAFGSGSQTDTFRFTRRMASAGWWRIAARWPASTNHAARSRWAVTHADGTTVVERDQRAQGGVWNDIGLYRFAAGANVAIAVSDEYGPYAVADAVRLEWVGSGLEPALEVNSSALPGGVVGDRYDHALQASGGIPPYQWSATGELPPGLTLSEDGLLSGTPSAAGSWSIAVRVSDVVGASAARDIALVIDGGVPAEIILDEAGAANSSSGAWRRLSSGAAYSGSYMFGGGTGLDRFSFATVMPASGWWRVSARWPTATNHSARAVWQTIHADGATSVERDQRVNRAQWVEIGVYRFQAGGNATVSVSDDYGPFAIADAVRLEWLGSGLEPALEVATEGLPSGMVGEPYEQALAAAGGIPPYRWTAEGALPSGLSLSQAGVLSGTPEVAGAWSIRARVEDATGASAARDLALGIDAPPGAIIIDQSDAANNSSGGWRQLNSAAAYGGSYVFGSSAGVDGFSFNAAVPVTGWWRVSARWPTATNHAPRALWTTTHADGTTSVERDQRANRAQWVDLGVYRFESQGGAVVNVSDTHGPFAVADAVRMEWVGRNP
jgi:hypothetical protein